jgi:hypothetical protein
MSYTAGKGISKYTDVQFDGNGSVTVWKAYNIGPGKKIHLPSTTPFISWLSVVKDFVIPAVAEGKISENRVEASTEESETECVCIFQSFSDMQEHCLVGFHSFQLDQLSSYDYVRMRWQDICLNLSHNAKHFQFMGAMQPHEENFDHLKTGWALKKDRKCVRFSSDLKAFLKEVFERGERSGQKMNPSTVARNMRICRNSHGKKRFQPDECLQPSQIAAFFSRLCVCARNQTSSVEDEDLETAVYLINKLEALDQLSITTE